MSAIFKVPDQTWTEFDQRFDLAYSPLYGSTGAAMPPLGAVVLTEDEWAAISVAFRFYQHAAGTDDLTGLEHGRVRSILLGLLARKP